MWDSNSVLSSSLIVGSGGGIKWELYYHAEVFIYLEYLSQNHNFISYIELTPLDIIKSLNMKLIICVTTVPGMYCIL